MVSYLSCRYQLYNFNYKYFHIALHKPIFTSKKMYKPLILIFFLFSNLTVKAQDERLDTLTTDKAIEYYQSILERNKNSSFAYYGLASAYFSKGDYRLAIKYSKHNLDNDNEYKVDSYMYYATALDRIGLNADAIKEFEKVTSLHPENYQLQYQYAFSCYKYRAFDKAINALKKVLIKSPFFTEAHYLLGCSLYEKSNDSHCIEAFTFGLFIDKDSLRSVQVIAFLKTYIDQKQDLISIPYFDTRLNLSSVNQIVNYYTPRILRNEIFTSFNEEHFVMQLSPSLSQPNILDFPPYEDFYPKLASNKLTEVFCRYSVRTAMNKEKSSWFNLNKGISESFINFLEKELPNN